MHVSLSASSNFLAPMMAAQHPRRIFAATYRPSLGLRMPDWVRPQCREEGHSRLGRANDRCCRIKESFAPDFIGHFAPINPAELTNATQLMSGKASEWY
jgi:hypothetical protein